MKDIQFQQINKQLEFIAQTVAGHEVRFDILEERLEKMSNVLISHDRRLHVIEDKYVTKKEFRELMNTIDFSVKAVMNMKEDHVFGVEWMKRMQDQLGWHEQDIRKLKLQLNLA